MRPAIIAFVAAICLLQQQANLPPLWPLLLLLLLCSVALLALRRSRRVGRGGGPWPRWQAALSGLLLLLIAALAGGGWATWRAQQRLAERLPAALEMREIVLTGVVSGLPQAIALADGVTPPSARSSSPAAQAASHSPAGIRLRFQPQPSTNWPQPGELLLSDYHAGAAYRPGQTWRLRLKLKQPHGQINPGAQDYEGWLLQQGIAATGSVRSGELLAPAVWYGAASIDQLRFALTQRLAAELAGSPAQGLVTALVNGDSAAISPTQWRLFQATGVVHLISISGLHVTLLAGLVATLVRWTWRRSHRAAAWLPAQQAALLAGVLTALAYSLLAGFAVPTQRSLLMLLVAATLLARGRQSPASLIWLLALGAVVLVDPWAVLAPGFWLSFLSVGVLVWAGSGELGRARWWRSFALAQWAATLASIPMLLLWFQSLPLLSPLCNALAIPLVSAVITPLALLGCVDPTGWAWQGAAWLGEIMLTGLGALQDWQQGWTWQWRPAAVSLPQALLGMAGVLCLLLPRGLPGRWLGSLLLLPLLWSPAVATPSVAGRYRLTLFDVGQGLAALVQAGDRALLFDTGPPGSGERVLLPALRRLGVQRLDVLVLSHDDNDHTGGAAAILAELPVHWLLQSAPAAGVTPPALGIAPRLGYCRAGWTWRWQGVDFAWLAPSAEQAASSASDNNKSCVLKVSSRYGRLLLTADIEAAAEAQLLASGADLQSEVLVLPHHGSRTSSTPDFIAAVAAPLALVPVGYQNRFHHPRAEVLDRYRAAGSQLLRTDYRGALTVDFAAEGLFWQGQRQMAARYWWWQPATETD